MYLRFAKIEVALRRAAERNSLPDNCIKLVRFPHMSLTKLRNAPLMGCVSYMVEPRGIEPLSEGNLTRLSPGAVCYLHSLCPAGTNTLRTSVAS